MTNDRTLKLAREAINAGIGYLAGAQAPSGYFPGQSSALQHNFDGAVSTRTNFNTSMVARILGSTVSSDQRALKMCAAASKFLLSQVAAGGSWNYWCTGAARSTLPDDLDDTFCALAAIQLTNAGAITPDTLNRAISLLVAAEALPGGPYRTWVVGSSAGAHWHDVDLAVNCNVAYFLQLRGIRVPSLEAYVTEQLAGGNFSSRYYPDAITVKYFLSRLGFVDKSLLQVDGVHESLPAAAMALSIAPTAGHAHAWAEQILGSVASNGSWRAFGFCLDPVVDGVRHYAGSRCLSTALCTEALEGWTTCQEQASASAENPYELYAVKRVSNTLQLFCEQSQNCGHRYLKKLRPLLSEITSVHVGFARACGLPQAFPSSSKNLDFMAEVAYASVCGWLAFTMYDDVADGDADPATLALANYFYHTFTKVYAMEFGSSATFHRFMFGMLHRVAIANVYELEGSRSAYPRLPRTVASLRIADRSMGHALSCAAVMFKAAECGMGYAMKPFESTMKFFRCYLAARQLHDDGHDWKADYGSGILNAVGADLVNAYASLHTLEPISVQWMEQEFAERGLARLCSKVCERVAEAAAIVGAEPAFKDKDFFYGLVEPLRANAERTLLEAQQGKEFIEAYKFSVPI